MSNHTTTFIPSTASSVIISSKPTQAPIPTPFLSTFTITVLSYP